MTTMRLRASAATTVGRVVAWATRRLQLGGGTAVPGFLALLVYPGLLDELARQLPHGTVIVAGTNGKTTTARALAALLQASGLAVVHNRSGSNLPRGIASAFVDGSSVTGRIRGEIAVVEVDEFALPTAVGALRPRLLVLLNLFRDQLDRYGELETVAQTWRGALAALPPDALVVVNADDPVLTALTEPLSERRWTFGLDDPTVALPALPHAADWRLCPRCGEALTYRQVFLGHLGIYQCTGCSFSRPPLTVSGRSVASVVPLRIEAVAGTSTITLESQLAGVYNAYNVLAAATAGLALGLDQAEIVRVLGSVEAAFGRQERVTCDGHELTLLLVKNPTGFNEAIRLLVLAQQRCPVLILINDLDADGRDVSWLWDVDVEKLRALDVPVSTGGIRGGEMALRLEYAGIEPVAQHRGVVEAFDRWIASLPPASCGWVLATYTAMLELRRALAQRGLLPSFWAQ
ncbi:MurT ligase domain-containing protein [Thermomicrobium sp. 4228-Ro]|uniref:MurT ligase domain-containing protein n=1 Tax=Thermomicrobium sp. 4228-Ro TaxID=2993937 RepID=UPI002248D081|nr:MurT ligase domain-containing protein [Thermomicrobium sp. 4228-Ro]MCX2727260.1 MurT ligase domain-containing protein [Thermomicrobium sp. 4228-Ro]